MSATPRTQAFKKTVGVPWWEFAELLETEIAELNERLIERQKTLIQKGVECEEMRKALYAEKAFVMRLLGLSEKLQAAEADAARLAVALEDIAARGRPHAGSPPGYPDGCECELCEDFDSISCALAAYETRKEKGVA